MKVTQNPSLKALNTFGVDARAGLMYTIENEEDLLSLPPFNPDEDLVLGGGSNILLADDIPGAVFLNRIAGRNRIAEEQGQVLIEAGAGEDWHQLVQWSLDHKLYGLENLSLIPGLVGAAPVQNIGAYGVELSDVLESVSGWDLAQACWFRFTRAQCELGYRDSRFKSREKHRYLVTSIRLRLNRIFEPQITYSGLEEEIALTAPAKLTGQAVSAAVTRLRQSRLPDPGKTGNAGSFFKNPVLPPEESVALQERHPDLPCWPAEGSASKFSAAWMIEYCGLKGYRDGDAAVSGKHALVLVNLGNASGPDIARLAAFIQSAVFNEFGVELEPEPRIIQFRKR
jgi:UDP-N-acetylmuramate dehydrogenase